MAGEQQPTMSEVLLNNMLILLPVPPSDDEVVVGADAPEVLLEPVWSAVSAVLVSNTACHCRSPRKTYQYVFLALCTVAMAATSFIASVAFFLADLRA